MQDIVDKPTYIELEVDNVAILYNVRLAFLSVLASRLYFCHPLSTNQIVWEPGAKRSNVSATIMPNMHCMATIHYSLLYL